MEVVGWEALSLFDTPRSFAGMGNWIIQRGRGRLTSN